MLCVRVCSSGVGAYQGAMRKLCVHDGEDVWGLVTGANLPALPLDWMLDRFPALRPGHRCMCACANSSPGARCKVQGARCKGQVQGPGVQGARCQVPGARCARCQVQGAPGVHATHACIHTHTHMHSHSHKRMHTHAHSCAQTRKHKHASTSACTCLHTHACKSAQNTPHTFTRPTIDTHTHATTQSRTCMHICIHTHANTEIHFPCPARLPAGDILDVCSGFMEKAAAGAGVPLIRPLWGVSGPDLLQVRAGLLATCSEPPQKSLCNAAASAAAGATATCGAAQALAPCSSKLRRLGAGTKVYIYEQIIPLSPISAQNTGYAS